MELFIFKVFMYVYSKLDLYKLYLWEMVEFNMSFVTLGKQRTTWAPSVAILTAKSHSKISRAIVVCYHILCFLQTQYFTTQLQ